MGKTITFRMIKNRFLFKCSHCNAKRSMVVHARIRQKNIRCHICGEMTKCAFNRRVTQREMQTGKIMLVSGSGKEVDVNLMDISTKGVGIEVSVKALRARAVKIGDQVQLACGWNPRLFSGSRFVVKNIIDRKVGLKKIIPGEPL